MSDGPIAILQRWSSNSAFTETPLYWLKAGVTGLILGLLASHLFGYGNVLWQEASWLLLVFFVLYTLCLLLVIPYLSHSSCASPTNFKQFSPSYPRGLTRLRSYFAFFPITHVINRHNGETTREGGRKGTLESLSNLSGECTLDGQDLSIRIGAQMDMAIEAIVSEYVSPWYTKISDDRSFLDQCKAIIKAVFLQLGEKLRQVDRNEFAKEVIQILHVHWKEYADALNKNHQGTGEEILKTFKFVHPFLQDNKEVSRRYQHLVGKVLEELAIPDLSASPVMCQFVAGILVKNFILYYVEMICQPSWVNGSLIALLSAGGMSVDITGSSSQNSSSPASPLPGPDPSSKPINIFGDEALECVPVCQPCTTSQDSTPTKKSHSSSGRSVSGSQSQEEYSAKSENNETKQFFNENLSSTSIEDGSSSEPKAESSTSTDSARPSPTEKQLFQYNKPSTSAGSVTNSIFSGEAIKLTKRPKDLQPLNASSSMRTVTTALGSVMQATAFPLLPSECLSEENHVALPRFCKPPAKSYLKSQNLLEEISETELQVEEDNSISDNNTFDSSEEIKQGSDELGKEVVEEWNDGVDEEEQSNEDESPSGNKSMASSHYYSFDEASKPKPAPTSFFETSTLSLDGAMESRKQETKDQLQLCSHVYKPESVGNDGKPNRSPVYEEPEDFAASIAKLRSLLEQKEAKASTPPPLSAPPSATEDGEVFESPSSSPATTGNSAATENKSSCENLISSGIPQISETCASDSHTTPSSTSSMDNSKASSRFSFNEPLILPSDTESTLLDSIDTERSNYQPVPEIKCCFRNVTIPKVETSADAGGQYMFYCIQYEGVYCDDNDSDHPQKLVYRTTTIKRRFKEFLTLQAHLEENAACKPHMKGMKTPTRWLNVSLTKSDAIVAHQRRAMLEKYLQQLCYHPIIGFCQEVMVFMAYGEDGFCSFEVGDPKDLLSHRLDKLARKFTGVFNSLKDALPSFELDISPAPNTPKSEGITPCDSKPESSFPSFPFQEKYSPLSHEKSPLEPPWIDKFNPVWNSENEESIKENEGNKSDEMLSDTVAFHAPEIEVEEGKIFSTYPLAAAVTQLLCDVLWLPQYRPHPASVATFMSISGKSLENYVVESMDICLSEEAILGYLEWLTISINNGQSDTDSRCDVSSEFISEQDLKNLAKRRIPAWVRWMWGRNRLDLTIDRITGLFQTPLVNLDLVLSLGELLFSKMVIVDETSVE